MKGAAAMVDGLMGALAVDCVAVNGAAAPGACRHCCCAVLQRPCGTVATNAAAAAAAGTAIAAVAATVAELGAAAAGENGRLRRVRRVRLLQLLRLVWLVRLRRLVRLPLVWLQLVRLRLVRLRLVWLRHSNATPTLSSPAAVISADQSWPPAIGRGLRLRSGTVQRRAVRAAPRRVKVPAAGITPPLLYLLRSIIHTPPSLLLPSLSLLPPYLLPPPLLVLPVWGCTGVNFGDAGGRVGHCRGRRQAVSGRSAWAVLLAFYFGR